MQPDHSILVSGGSSGLGAACVEPLAQRGCGIVVADLAPPAASTAELSERITYARADVTSEADLQQAIRDGEERFGPLRGAVVCAGVLHAERTLGRDGPASLDAFRRAIEVNLVGTFNTVRLAAAAIAAAAPDAEGQRGVIVMTSSVAAYDGQIGQASYAASKGGVASMTLPLAREFGKQGIRVVSIAPGVFDTAMMQAAPGRVRESLIGQTPFPQRLGRPQEFAALVTHVFDNPMLNGCVLRLDAALRMGAN